jgi:hypothetical protein
MCKISRFTLVYISVSFRLLGPARPTAELASIDRERLAEAKLVGGLPEARKVIQQLHAEVASTRRIKSQYLSPNYGSGSNLSTIQLRSSYVSRLAVPSNNLLPQSVAIITPCGSRDMWVFRPDKLYSSFVDRTDLKLEKGVYILDFGAIRNTIEEARRDAALTDMAVSSTTDEEPPQPLEKEDLVELGTSSGRQTEHQSSVWGFCAVAEVNPAGSKRAGFVGVCIFCDVILTAGPVRGSKSSAECDAFAMISEVLASGITYAASHYVMPTPNPAEDIFEEPTAVEESEYDEMMSEEPSFEETKEDDDLETRAPITPSGPAPEYVETVSTEH